MHGDQEGAAWNGHFQSKCLHPLFVFNQFGDLERCTLRPGNVHSADGWEGVLRPVLSRYSSDARPSITRRRFRADAAFAIPALFDLLEAEGWDYAIRIKSNQKLYERISWLTKRRPGRPPNHLVRHYTSFHYRAKSWSKPRRIVAKVEFHPGELFPTVGFIVTNRNLPNERILAFYNDRGTAEQHIKEGKYALKWTRLSCMRFAANTVRLQLHALAYNLANFLRTLATPELIERWSLTSLRERLIKTGVRLVRHARYAIFQMAEVALPRQVFAGILALIFRWIATARGGVEQTLGPVTVFASGGVAAARIYNSVTDIDFGPNIPRHIDRDDSFRDSSTRIGWVIGLGVEAPLADAWTLRLEGSSLDFGRSKHYVNRSGNNRCGAEGPRRPCPYSVENKLGIVRLAIIRRFDL